MKTTKLYILSAIFAMCLLLGWSINFFAAGAVHKLWTQMVWTGQEEPTTDQGATVRVALLLDTSNSMSGLINQAKSQLWNIVNELQKLELDGETPRVMISLYQYGNDHLREDKHYVEQLLPLTTDMDKVSEHLFGLAVYGGSEYCGAAIGHALENLEWGTSDKDLRMIYIAGNESFEQGPISYAKVQQMAARKNIKINTIFCGSQADGTVLGWSAAAALGGGTHLHMDHNMATAYQSTPYDDQIQDLNNRLNRTYVPYGQLGNSRQMTQRQQDQNAHKIDKANAVDRAVFKGSKAYNNAKWDLVDAYKKDKSILKKKDLGLKGKMPKSTKELEKLIQTKEKQRKAIQEEIRQLDKKRRKYLSEKPVEEQAKNLKNAIVTSVEKATVDRKKKKSLTKSPAKAQ
ncbi:MAG: VWA domain-containing protein [Bacteroidota bacterium]